jgi:hypothetical protein
MYAVLESHEIQLATFTEDRKELAALMDTNSIDILRALAQNPRAYKKHLKALATHDDAEVRASVASNESTAAPVLAELAKDPAKDVRFYVALNISTPKPALNILLNDSDGEIARMARISIEALEDKGHQRKYGSCARFVSNALAVSFGLISLMDDTASDD